MGDLSPIFYRYLSYGTTIVRPLAITVVSTILHLSTKDLEMR
jgi:hypothetical protein